MHRFCNRLFLLTILLALGSVSARAAAPPPIAQALTDWSGERRLLLRTELNDPLGSPVVQALVAELVNRGFQVTPAPPDAEAPKGLILDLRSAGADAIIALSRADDGAIIAFAKMQEGTTAEAVEQEPDKPPQPQQGEPQTAARPCLPPGLNEIDGTPRAVAVLSANEARCDILLLRDDELGLYRASPGTSLEKIAAFPAPSQPSRALYLGTGDIDDDEDREIAVVWAEDEKSIYEGVDSRLHAWILRYNDGRFRPASADLEAYLRICTGKGYLQRRGRHAAFAGPVFHLEGGREGLVPGQPAAWPTDRSIYAATPVGKKRFLATTDDARPALLALKESSTKPLFYFPDTLGEFEGPEMATRSAETEYRLGLEKEGQVHTDYHALARPVLLSKDGDAYTVRRGREEGIPLVSAPSGKDEIVRLETDHAEPRVASPFDGVAAFILDFALLENGDAVSALLLVNEEADGDGTAYLIRQQQTDR